MDMGDILAQWDNIQSDKVKKQKESGKNTVSHKKANAPTPEEKALAKENVTLYHFGYNNRLSFLYHERRTV